MFSTTNYQVEQGAAAQHSVVTRVLGKGLKDSKTTHILTYANHSILSTERVRVISMTYKPTHTFDPYLKYDL